MLSLQSGMLPMGSRSSSSSASSLSSSFSDISFPTSASSPSPSKPKPIAFIASTRSHSPDFQVPCPSKSHLAPHATALLPSESFETPTRQLSPQPQTLSPKSLLFPSHIFPSRHSSSTRKNIENHVISVEGKACVSPSRTPDPSTSGDTRLPTPPLISSKVIHHVDEAPPSNSTPKPPHLAPDPDRLRNNSQESANHYDEMNDNHLELGSLITIPWSNVAPSAWPSPISSALTIALPTADSIPSHSRDCGDNRSPIPKVGGISSSNRSAVDHAPDPQSTSGLRSSASTKSLSSLSLRTDKEDFNPTISALHHSSSELRLLKLLGHGTFSSVWLGEDLGRVPLTRLSKRGVRDLRRRASGRQRKNKLEDDAFTTPFHGYDDGFAENRRSSVRHGQGLRNKPSSLKIRPSGTLASSGNPHHDHVGSLSRHPTLPSPSPSFYGEFSSGSPPSPYSPMSTLPPLSPLSPLSLNFRAHDGHGLALSRDASLRKFRERVKGTRPSFLLGRTYLDERDGGIGTRRGGVADELGFLTTGEEDGKLSRRSSLGKSPDSYERLIAIKVTPRRTPGTVKEEEERTRVRFVREVEVLKHISHPNITPLLAHLSTPQHHILILPYLPGGDLLTLVNNDVAWGKLTESMVRRMWCELCKAVGWMHGVGLVHRDIKLENILLTTPAFTELTPESSLPSPTSSSIPQSPSPLIKLADFGLSRFVEINQVTGEAELLTTRCGSEAYAAPELVTGGRAGYDARKTDAWACGVVLYAMIGRRLPFGEGVSVVDEADGRRIGGEKSMQSAFANLAERRHWLMKIARGEWIWPGEETGEVDRAVIGSDEELFGPNLRKSLGSRRIVERLLVRDPRKRTEIDGLWDDVWMMGGTSNETWREHERHLERPNRLSAGYPTTENVHLSPPVIVHDYGAEQPSQQECGPIWILGDSANGQLHPELHHEPSLEEGTFYDEDDEGGVLLDHEGIDSITRQEVV